MLATGLGIAPAGALPAAGGGDRETAGPGPAQAAYGRLPLAFEANQGQADGRVQFLARGRGYGLFLTAGEAVLGLRRPGGDGAMLRITVVGARPAARATGLEALPGRSHYFIGSDPAKWRTNVPTYAKVEYRDVYPGVSLVYYGTQRELEYDLVVAPGADPGRITLAFEGAERVELDRDGNLILGTTGGVLVSRAPLIYQELGGVRQRVAGGYRLQGSRRVGFRVGVYDRRHALVIDPVLGYSTYLGGTAGDGAAGVAVDGSGNAYMTGSTVSTDFPTQNPAQASNGGGSDAFVTKLNATGSGLLYSTYLGGSGNDDAFGIAVDASGNAYVVGRTDSTDFPVPSGFQATNAGGAFDGFVTRLNAAGSVVLYSTYLGGTSDDQGFAIAVRGSGEAYVTGSTTSGDFPTSVGAYQSGLAGVGDAFVAKFDTTAAGPGSRSYATYLGGGDFGIDDNGFPLGPEGERAFGIAVDASGNAYVTGSTLSTDFPKTTGAYQSALAGFRDAFVTKLDAAGSALLYSTFLGGNATDEGRAVALDSSGNAYVTGFTNSAGFPTANALQSARGGQTDAFVAKLDPTASGSASLPYATFLGGGDVDLGLGIGVDASGNAYVAGSTNSSNFPTRNAIQSAIAVSNDAFAAKLDPSQAGAASLIYSTYLGGSGGDFGRAVAVDATGNAYVVGSTDSSTFPVTAGAYQTTLGGALDAFVTRINAADAATAAAGQAVSVSTAPGVGGQAGVSATLTNAGGSDATVTAETLTSNPGTTTGIIDAGGGYVDLKVSGVDSSDSMTARFYYPSTVTGSAEAGLILLSFDGVAWVAVAGSGGAAPVKDTTDNLDGTLSGGRFTVTFDDTSTPKLVDMTGTPFSAALFSTTTLTVGLDIKPGSFPNSINRKSRGKIPVAILSTATFAAPTEVDRASLTFGQTGDETSLAFCNPDGQDVDGDGRADLVCHFDTRAAGFQVGDAQGFLKGTTLGGTAIAGSDSIRIVP
jgi:hypothetical protein